MLLSIQNINDSKASCKSITSQHKVFRVQQDSSWRIKAHDFILPTAHLLFFQSSWSEMLKNLRGLCFFYLLQVVWPHVLPKHALVFTVIPKHTAKRCTKILISRQMVLSPALNSNSSTKWIFIQNNLILESSILVFYLNLTCLKI